MSHSKRIRSALWMIPLAMGAILFLPTPWMGAIMAVLLLAGLQFQMAVMGTGFTGKIEFPQPQWNQ